eukprot:742184-Pyramimonas_sp.AAC.1
MDNVDREGLPPIYLVPAPRNACAPNVRVDPYSFVLQLCHSLRCRFCSLLRGLGGVTLAPLAAPGAEGDWLARAPARVCIPPGDNGVGGGAGE